MPERTPEHCHYTIIAPEGPSRVTPHPILGWDCGRAGMPTARSTAHSTGPGTIYRTWSYLRYVSHISVWSNTEATGEVDWWDRTRAENITITITNPLIGVGYPFCCAPRRVLSYSSGQRHTTRQPTPRRDTTREGEPLLVSEPDWPVSSARAPLSGAAPTPRTTVSLALQNGVDAEFACEPVADDTTCCTALTGSPQAI